MPKLIDMTGQVFERLTVLSRVPATGQARWLCRCECGNTNIASGSDLRTKRIHSCGCWNSERFGLMNKTHGRTKTKEYFAWYNMRTRCTNPSSNAYARYGAIGITVCDRWMHSFENFFSDLGLCPEGHTLDRIDPSKGYEPSNCRWADSDTQQNNKRRVKFITYRGKTQSVAQWCRDLGLNHKTIRTRIYTYKWNPVKALTTPIR